MKKQPDQIVTCTLSVVLMPQGEVICYGKTVGWFKDLKNDLTLVADVTGKPITEKDL